MAIQSYHNLMHLKEAYSTLMTVRYLLFEQRLYQYVQTVLNRGKNVITYRCEEEQHTIQISIDNGTIIDVQAFYKI